MHSTQEGPGEGSLEIGHQVTLPSGAQIVHGRSQAEASEYTRQDHLADWQIQLAPQSSMLIMMIMFTTNTEVCTTNLKFFTIHWAYQ